MKNLEIGEEDHLVGKVSGKGRYNKTRMRILYLLKMQMAEKLAQWSEFLELVGSVLSWFGLALPASQLQRLREENQKVAFQESNRNSKKLQHSQQPGQHAPSRSPWRRPTGYKHVTTLNRERRQQLDGFFPLY